MQRRVFLRTGAAAAMAASGVLSLPELARGARTIRRPVGEAGPIRLSSNENPLGVPAGARQAVIDRLADGNRYPGLRADVTRAVAGLHGVDPSGVVLGNGSTEVLQMVVQAVSTEAPGARLVIPDPTFEHVEEYAGPHRIQIVKVPLRPDFAHDLEAMRRAAEAASGPVLVFICNPNNPTGTLTPCADVERWIMSAPEDVRFLVDEAYFDFVDDAGYRTMLPHVGHRGNLIVSRTFSKIYGLAGLRLGYGVGGGEFIERVRAFSANTNINDLASAAALAALEDEDYIRRSLEVNSEGRAFAYEVLRALDLEYLPSHTNFLMHRIRGELQAYIDRMLEAGIRVGRPFPPMLEYSRVSIGLPDEMRAWADALRGFRRQGWV